MIGKEEVDMLAWQAGWVFFKMDGHGGVPAGDDPAETLEWMKGFGAAMADYDLEKEYPSVQAALVDHGIDGDLLADCLDAAELIVAEPEFNRWPSDRPIRGWGEQ